jgi:multiple sugar transport system substrate-binding protein
VLTFSGSAVGREAEILERQFDRFETAHPPWRVELRSTPDSADERRQLYVQWLNARAARPDVLQLDVIWTAEFAAAGWIRALDDFAPVVSDFFPGSIEADRWRGSLYALPWFVDVGMLYWRTDLMPQPPATFEALMQQADDVMQGEGLPFGFVWQGARYEGLVTVFLEHLGGFGGQIVDEHGEITVDSEEAVRALTYMRDAIWSRHVVPSAVLTWQEEQSRFAFQNGQAAFMRNWPYAHALMQDSRGSRVAGKFDISLMPAAAGGSPTAALGGSHLAINAYSAHANAAFDLIAFLTAPDQMLERARVAGQFPSRLSLYDTPALTEALGLAASSARRVIESARPRPVTPIYSELSDILQIRLHRALSQQQEPREALGEAASAMRAALTRAGLDGGTRRYD